MNRQLPLRIAVLLLGIAACTVVFLAWLRPANVAAVLVSTLTGLCR